MAVSYIRVTPIAIIMHEADITAGRYRMRCIDVKLA